MLPKINPKSLDISYLKDLKRTYSIYEIAIMTRSSPAEILGLNDRGSLKEGCIADISIFDPRKPIDQMFRKAKYVFKNGEEIVKNGKILKYKKTSTIAANINYEKSIVKNVENWTRRFYSLDKEEFKVDKNFFRKDNFIYS